MPLVDGDRNRPTAGRQPLAVGADTPAETAAMGGARACPVRKVGAVGEAVADGVVADPEAAEVVFVAEAVKDSRIELKEPLGGL